MTDTPTPEGRWVEDDGVLFWEYAQGSTMSLVRSDVPEGSYDALAELVRRGGTDPTPEGTRWFVTTDWLRHGGSEVAGPFTTRRDALAAREAIERAASTASYFIDARALRDGEPR